MTEIPMNPLQQNGYNTYRMLGHETSPVWSFSIINGFGISLRINAGNIVSYLNEFNA
jgi:hypothetical protein